MPLAHDGRLVAGPLEQLGEGLLRAVERGAEGVVGVAVGVGVLAREHAGAARAAQRVGHEAVGEADALIGDAVEVGRRGVTVVVAAHHLRRVVVGHDVEDVHRAAGRLGAGAAAGGRSRHGGNAAGKQKGGTLHERFGMGFCFGLVVGWLLFGTGAEPERRTGCLPKRRAAGRDRF